VINKEVKEVEGQKGKKEVQDKDLKVDVEVRYWHTIDR
jgi:hypothetical protein